MKEFTFNGDWEFKLNLNEFFNSNLRWRENMDPQNAKPNVKIVDLKSYDPDPLKEQINTINFIINNELRVLEAICKALVPINNDYGEKCGQYDWFPERLTAENLGEVLLIQEISILKEHKDDQAYYELSCGYKGDEEHGLIIVMHGVQLFDYSAIGEMDYINLYKDLGERAKIFIEINKIENEFQAHQMQKVLPKYGKYKPWQKEYNATPVSSGVLTDTTGSNLRQSLQTYNACRNTPVKGGDHVCSGVPQTDLQEHNRFSASNIAQCSSSAKPKSSRTVRT